MIVPARAHVRPQVFTARSEVALYLEDEVRERLDSGDVGLVRLMGPPGSGKSAGACAPGLCRGE